MDFIRYRSDIDDNARWDGFPFRSGDIVISTRSKHGTTWAQMICALLVHGPRLPEPLGRLAPWVDWELEPRGELLARLDAQRHRRVLKTHMPLDGLPVDDRATYVVVARHPVDAALSLYHQGDNIDRAKVAAMLGHGTPRPRPARPDAPDWIREWARDRHSPEEWLEGPRGVLHHVTQAWGRARRGEQRVVLVHYADLLADLPGQMRRLSVELDLPRPEREWPALVAAATFEAMRADAAATAPDPGDTFLDKAAFYRSGRSGDGVGLLPRRERRAFDRWCRSVASDEVVDWLLR